MKLVVGLGNPGRKYEKNRHNVGFMVVDALASAIVDGQWSMVKKFQSSIINYKSSIVLVKSLALMNSSGRVVKNIIAHFKLKMPELWVIHDDLDIRLGDYKVQKGKGPKDHKGLNSIYKALGTRDFWHVRVGVDNRTSDNRISGEEYVLKNFTDKEFGILDPIIDKIVKDLINRLEVN
jgi:PTH1 family peptidyl-tRNA hydrolase